MCCTHPEQFTAENQQLFEPELHTTAQQALEFKLAVYQVIPQFGE